MSAQIASQADSLFEMLVYFLGKIRKILKIRLLIVSRHAYLALWVKNSADDILEYFSYFSKKTGLDISCKLSPVETICMICQILFSGNKHENITNLSSAELAQSVVKTKR